ncbi:MAG: cytoplasmic dynein 2 light intermediate chain 1 [Monoraphidium minutum]|nr:MAG: cytoplasmic dynein 2 light intermediate chain 1 [Monoraphidium minutum]
MAAAAAPAPAAAGPRQCPLWAVAAEQQAAAVKATGSKEAFVYVCGARGCGKTTLLNRLLRATKADAPPPSDCLEYTYAFGGGGGDDRTLAHFWELGGHEAAGLALARSDRLFLSFKQVTAAAVVICVDLSDPAAVLPSARQWLSAVRSKLAATYAAFERKGLQLPEQLRQRARLRLAGGSGEGRDAIDVTGIPIVLAATKWDAFRGRDTEEQRTLGLALRCLAHANGTHLAYLGGLQPGGGAGAEGMRVGGVGAAQGSSAALQAAALDRFVRLVSHLAFTGLDKKMSLKMAPQTAPLAPLMVPAGADRLADIGRPGARAGAPHVSTAGASAEELAAAVEEWGAAAAAVFPGVGPRGDAPAEAARRLVADPRYGEDNVDGARRRWEDTAPPQAEGSGAAMQRGGSTSALAAARSRSSGDEGRERNP